MIWEGLKRDVSYSLRHYGIGAFISSLVIIWHAMNDADAGYMFYMALLFIHTALPWFITVDLGMAAFKAIMRRRKA